MISVFDDNHGKFIYVFRTRSRWRKYCKKCCRYCSGVLLALVLCACVLSIALLFWFSLRLYRDVENLSRRLTIEINRGLCCNSSYVVIRSFFNILRCYKDE